MVKQTKNKITSFVNFLQNDIWRIKARDLKGFESLGIRQLRIILLAFRGFTEDKCQLRASALTFYSLLSVVPFAAMGFGIAKGFGFEKKLEDQILTAMQGQEEVAHRIIDFSQSFLQKTQGGLIAGVGVAILFWTVIKVLGNIESSFNDIWGIKKSRSFGRKFADYMSIMMICPILLIMSSSITVLVTSQITLIMSKLAFLGSIADLILSGMQILSYLVVWVGFAFIYIFMPNTKVNLSSGILAGVIAGTTYKIVQWAYITFQVGVSKYGAIYGSFAALPLFLMWLQVSWLIVLFGAEISFSEQNVETYEFEPDALKAKKSFKRLVALHITRLCVKNFEEGKKALTVSEIAHQLESPIRLVNEILFNLTEAGVLSETKVGDKEVAAYQPGRSLDQLSIKAVMDLLDEQGIDQIPLAQEKEFNKIKSHVEQMNQLVRNSKDNVLLKDI